MEDDHKPSIEHQRRFSPSIQEVVKKEILKLLKVGIIYHISGSAWVSPAHVVPKKGGITIVKNENNELVPTRTITGWHMHIDYQKLNKATYKDHFSLPFIDQMLEWSTKNSYLYYLDGHSGFFKSLSILMTKKRLLLHVLMVHMLIEECHLGYAMPLPHFNIVWWPFFLILLRTSWKSL